ncbi:CpaF family protein [Streptomyces mirabilis]|uniref:ATPase, T2SS/T4P/T4SS family n=1 Tax=Streptomyces mirabilis TaxID=68239 RepID=A0ABU3V4V4_9ACTN|nr:ATPase, T2SS/T4P/T4SS family [Streptomyces mirabilis]MCX5355565.1 ATPase, T2SS/T4P/T4SS family [Streptomyces mirabilis]MDU9001211.1 ATPase, T2SS/T4P/T4SS family [Streptomyces mirabilis]
MAETNGQANGQTMLGGLLAQHAAHRSSTGPAAAKPTPPGAPEAAASPTAPVVPASRPANSADPAGTAAVAELPGTIPVPWEEIIKLRQLVADDVDRVKKERRRSGQELEERHLAEVTRSCVRNRVAEWATTWVLSHPPLSDAALERVRTEVFNLIHLAGEMQQVLDRPEVEDVLIDGEWMCIDSNGRPQEWVRSPFSSKRQAIEWVNQMASTSGHGERLLSYTTGAVDFELPDGSRVAATVLTQRVTIAIRRHTLERATLADLHRRGMVDSVLASFLSAAVKAGLTVLIAGNMATGKTTLMRALGREVPAHERVATLESDRELNLDGPDTPAHVLAFQAREGNGERDASGRAIGEITLSDLVRISLRYKATRVMVGEVRGDEAVAMLEAMVGAGVGGMCTVHSKVPETVIERLIVPLARAGLSGDASIRLIAAAVDLIVYVDKIDETHMEGGRVHRHVTHVWETAGRSDGGGVALSKIFAPKENEDGQVLEERAVPTGTPMSDRRMRQLERYGFDRRWLVQLPFGQWPQLELVRRAA